MGSHQAVDVAPDLIAGAEKLRVELEEERRERERQEAEDRRLEAERVEREAATEELKAAIETAKEGRDSAVLGKPLKRAKKVTAITLNGAWPSPILQSGSRVLRDMGFRGWLSQAVEVDPALLDEAESLKTELEEEKRENERQARLEAERVEREAATDELEAAIETAKESRDATALAKPIKRARKVRNGLLG